MENAEPHELKGLHGESSPKRKAMVLEHRLQLEDKREKNTWNSCCLTLDRRAVQYFTQMGIICGVMLFCIIQLLGEEPDTQVYLGMLTMMLGLIFPNPKFKDNAASGN